MADPRQPDALRGTIDMLILKALTLEPAHGWGIGQRIQQISGDTLAANQGSVYPALQRLEHKGLVISDWGESDSNRRARYYRLTAPGRAALRTEQESWRRFARAVELALAAT